MKVLIVGSRNIDNFDLSPYINDEVSLIISGGAKGIDTIAENFADKNNISKLVLKPNYKKYGKYAPLKRNEMMVDIADMIIAIWDGVSKGTRHTIDYAIKTDKKLTVIKNEG